MVAQKKSPKHEPGTIGFRFTQEDRAIIAALKAHLGVQSISDIVRQSLRALANKEGISA